MNDWLDRINVLNLFHSGDQKLTGSLSICLLLWIFHLLINKIVSRQTTEAHTRYNWRKGSSYALFFAGLILIGRLWIQGLEPVLTFLGLIAAALTVTQKESIMNLVGFIFILWRNLFLSGDRVQIGTYQGDVIGIGFFYFTLMEIGNWVGGDQSTGRIIKVPNSLILTTPITNYTKGFPFIWNEMALEVTFESDWKKARMILQTIAEKQTVATVKKAEGVLKTIEDEMIKYHYLTPMVYVKPHTMKPVGILLTLRYLCEPRMRRDSESRMWEAILDEFSRHEDLMISFET
ncbi:mechanosensitive ion channel domain-containing protein [Deltaproteobacteria bacterium TL4]